jgi:putative transcriptional regulator
MIRLKVFERMAQKGFKTRLALAEATGVHHNSLGKVVNGDVLALRFDTLNKLCEVLECQPGDLLEYVPDAEVKQAKKSRRTA